MKHLAISAPFAVGRQQAKPAFSIDIGVATGRALKDLAVLPFGAVRIKEVHKIEGGTLCITDGATLPYVLLRTIVDRSHISRAHVAFYACHHHLFNTI